MSPARPLSRKLAVFAKVAGSLGLLNTLHFKVQQFRAQRRSRHQPILLRTRLARFPLVCRPDTTDIHLFHQIFVEKAYRFLDDEREVGWIVDLGANVGYSAAYLLTRFPGSRVLAVEPDPDNFAILSRNLAPYGDRARLVKSAVWSQAARLVLNADAREWNRSVREAREGERADIEAVGVADLLREHGIDRVSILKMDIEGSEREVFGRGHEEWLGRVRTIATELHGDECREVFERAVRGIPATLSEPGGGLTLWKRAAAG